MTMRYRRLGENNEPMMGQSQQDFLTDIDAVGLAIVTRLRLYKGEWWEDVSIGLPLWQSMLGVPGSRKDAIDRIIQDYIIQTLNVVSLNNVYSEFNSERKYQFYCEVNTIFGPISVTNNQGEIDR